MMSSWRLRGAITAMAVATLILAMFVALTQSHAAAPRVLRVGTWHGVRGNEPTINAAVAALRPGDWLLIGPGDWHPQMDKSKAQAGVIYPSAMLITTSHVHVRGMNRNQVIIDGTKPHAAPCSKRKSAQDFGQKVHGVAQGRNGPEALFSNDVTFENFTVCNFLTGSQDTGNEIWWNGGDDAGKIGANSWHGNYLTATTTYFDPKHPNNAAQYGMFVSASRGPGELNHSYSSNFNDSSYYIGACRNCHSILNHAHAENSALGLSATNSGGHFIVENSEFDQNKAGLVSNSMNSGDPPAPQLGNCVTGKGPMGTGSCDIWRRNNIHNNNNPNVPYAGEAGFGPVGTGIVLAGTHNITLYKNRITDNKAWGVLTTIFPDTGDEAPHSPANCRGGVANGDVLGISVKCLFYTTDNIVKDNSFSHNGGYRNQTNGDLADLAFKPSNRPHEPGNCFVANKNTGGALKTWPHHLEKSQGACGKAHYPAAGPTFDLAEQASCASGLLIDCPDPSAAHYPKTTHVKLKVLHPQPTMPNPCAGVPANPWCPAAADAAGPSPRAALTLSSGFGAPWPYSVIALGFAIAATTWRRVRRTGQGQRRTPTLRLRRISDAGEEQRGVCGGVLEQQQERPIEGDHLTADPCGRRDPDAGRRRRLGAVLVDHHHDLLDDLRDHAVAGAKS
jgi:hypothetical protein